jgi:hypothetical protein
MRQHGGVQALAFGDQMLLLCLELQSFKAVGVNMARTSRELFVALATV